LTAVFGGGNFFIVEAIYRRIRGVTMVVIGFSGGHHPNPNHELVLDEEQEDTGHSQVCQITYDPDRITYTQLLEVLFMIHDPSQHNKQGQEKERSFKSVIFYTSQQQKVEAEAFLAKATKSSKKKVVTELIQFGCFFQCIPEL